MFVGPLVGLQTRAVSQALARTWVPKVLDQVARSCEWEVCLPQSASLHTLLEPFSRRTGGATGRGPTSSLPGSSVLAGPELFDAIYILLARTPAAAEEPQLVGRLDEECAVIENMRRSPLIIAARCGLVGVAWAIARHCRQGALGLNQQDAMGCTALRYAIVNKDERMCRCLLSFSGVDLELPDARGDGALLQAVGANAPAVCQLLLKSDADVGFANRGQTALDLADALGYDGCSAALQLYDAPRGCQESRCGASGLAWPSPESELDDEVRESNQSPWSDAALGSTSAPWAGQLLRGGEDARDDDGSSVDCDETGKLRGLCVARRRWDLPKPDQQDLQPFHSTKRLRRALDGGRGCHNSGTGTNEACSGFMGRLAVQEAAVRSSLAGSS